MRLVLSVLATLVLALGTVQSALADTIGYVDFDKILTGYDQAQSVLADIKVREADLRKLQAEYVKQIEEARKNAPKNPVGANQLEKDLNEKLAEKVREYRDWASVQQKNIDDALESSIKEVAQSKGIDVVLTRNAVFDGGSDLTNEVLAKLNGM